MTGNRLPFVNPVPRYLSQGPLGTGFNLRERAMKMDQTCPCGVTEAAGSYCTRCLRKTQESWLHRPVVSEASKRNLRPNTSKESPLSESEQRALWGDR